MPDDEKTRKDYEAFSRLVDLWSKENPIKTTKLQVLLAVNGLLLSAVQLNDGFVEKNLPLFFGGALFSLIWTLSIGRTALFQKIWRKKLESIAANYPEDARFKVFENEGAKRQIPLWLRILGGVSSKYYLLCAPFILCIIWLIVGIYILL